MCIWQHLNFLLSYTFTRKQPKTKKPTKRRNTLFKIIIIGQEEYNHFKTENITQGNYSQS